MMLTLPTLLLVMRMAMAIMMIVIMFYKEIQNII